MKERYAEHAGMAGWAIVGATIIATEILSPQTLSTASDRMLQGVYGKATRTAWLVGSSILFAHTMNLLPEKIDPIHQVVGRLCNKMNMERLCL